MTTWPIIGPLFKGSTIELVTGVSVGAVASTALAPQLVNLLSQAWAGAANPNLRPVWTALTGAVLGAGLSFIRPMRRFGGYFIIGGAVAGVTSAISTLGRNMGWPGFQDYVQLNGYRDYVQMRGLGNQAMVEAGRFQGMRGLGTQAQVEAGQFGNDHSGTFAPSF